MGVEMPFTNISKYAKKHLVTELLISGIRYHCKTVNTFKKHLSHALESGAV